MSTPHELIAAAEKLQKPQSGLMGFFSGSSSLYRLEEASDLYVQAANAYRLQKEYDSAGKQFLSAANLQKQLGNHNDVANHLVEAYKCFKGTLPSEAIAALSQAIHIFLTQNGQFRRAANFTMDLAEIHELVGDLKAAVASYEQAGDYFVTDHAEALSNKAFLKCADLSALLGDYKKAVELYERVIKASLGNLLTKWSLKDYFFKAILCVLARGDPVEARKMQDAYAAEEPSWEATRESRLVLDVLDAILLGDVQAFSDKVFEYDQFSKLDKLKTQLLLKVKDLVDDDDEDLT